MKKVTKEDLKKVAILAEEKGIIKQNLL